MPDDSALRHHLLELLRGGQAHITLDEAVKDFPIQHIGVRPAGAPHSAWELLEHIRIALSTTLCASASRRTTSPRPGRKAIGRRRPAPKERYGAVARLPFARYGRT